MAFWCISALQMVLLLILERKIYKQNVLSPILFLYIPFLVVTLLAVCFAKPMDFITLNGKLFIIWWIGILFVWFGGIWNKFFIPKKNRLNENISFKRNDYKSICIAVTILSSISILIRAYILFRGSSLDVFASNDFSTILAQGLFGWIRIALLISLTYILCVFRIRETSLIEIISIILGLLAIVIYQIKGIILLPLVTCLVYQYMNGKKIFSFKVIWSSVVIGISVFFVAYALPYILSGDYSVLTDSEFYKYIAYKILNYCWAGILAFSGFMNIKIETSEPWYIIIAPIFNVVRRLWGGEGISPVSSYFLSIGTQTTSNVYKIGTEATSNVFTIFGNIYIFSNYLGLIFMSFVMGFFIYWSMEMAIKNPKNVWYKLGYAVVLFYMIMGIFDYFFNQAYVLIMITFIYIIGNRVEHNYRKENFRY